MTFRCLPDIGVVENFVNSLGNLAILYWAYIRFRYATTRVYSCVIRGKEDYDGMITWLDLLLWTKDFFLLLLYCYYCILGMLFKASVT